jgi:protein gp37
MANLDRMRRRLFALIDATSNLDWLLLTKRPENILSMWPDCAIEPCETLHSDGRKNVWLGTSVENQEYADKRIPALIQCRDLSPVLFLSCEPLLGSLDLNFVRDNPPIDWVIVGGESGPNARPSHPDWFRSIRDQCSAAGVPFHFKQWGEFDEHQKRVGKKAAGRLLDGEEHGHFES